MIGPAPLRAMIFCVLATAIAMTSSGDAVAHRARLSLTTIEWRPDQAEAGPGTGETERGGEIHVTHELHAHDALQALSALTTGDRLELADLKGQAKIAIAVENAFAVDDGHSGPIALETIGAELAGNYFYVFQVGRLDRAPAALTVRNVVFREFFPDQINQTNVTVGAVSRSLTFSGDDDARSVDF